MKKILVLMILSLVGFTNMFGCTCPFDEVEELTCEVKYMICRECNFDIEVCDNIKEKVKQFENDYTKACEEDSTVAKSLKKIDERIKSLEESYESKSNRDLAHRDLVHRDLAHLYLERSDLQRKYIEANKASTTLMNDFLGEEGFRILSSEELLLKLAEKFGY